MATTNRSSTGTAGPSDGCWFDERDADSAVRFIEKRCKHAIGHWAGQPFILLPWQRDIVRDITGWKAADGKRLYRMVYVEVPKGNGKALALDTPIPTVRGWTTMGEVQVGDVVFDEYGKPCPVHFVSDVMHGHDCYRVHFDDGSEIVADAEHLWLTEKRHGGFASGGDATRGRPRSEQGAWRHGIRTTREIAETIRYTNGQYQSANHSIPVIDTLELPVAILPVEPYALGAWLGDGDSDAARITVADADAELIRIVASAGTPVSSPRRYGERTPRYALGGGFSRKLRAAGVFRSKHIPEVYLRASAGQRLALLQGLMDTDGTISARNGQCEFTTTKLRLRDGFVELARSLGLKVSARESRATLNGRDCGPHWRIAFFPPSNMNPFRLRRKAERHVARTERRRLSRDHRVVACEPTESVPVRCIGVGSASSLFLAGSSMVPTHNTPLLGAIVCLFLYWDGDPRAEIYGCAADKSQAQELVFEDTKNFVLQSPELAARSRILTSRIVDFQTGSYFRVLSADAPTKHGFRPSLIAFDEFHTQPNRRFYDTMRAGLPKRRESMLFMITTAGEYDEESVCYQEHLYAEGVLKGRADPEDPTGIEDPTYYPVIYAADPKADPGDPETWAKANPSLGVTMQAEDLAVEWNRAKHNPAEQATFKRLHLNVWVEAEDGIVPMDRWRDCAVEPVPLGPCFIGMDLSSKLDLTSVVAYFPKTHSALAFFWIPEDNIEDRRRRDIFDYPRYAREGWITLTDGNVVDQQMVRAKINELVSSYDVVEIGYDSWNAVELERQLADEDGLRDRLVEVRQGSKTLSDPMKSLIGLVKDRDLKHEGNPVFDWCAANLRVRRDANDNWAPKKDKVGRKRIDGWVALIMARAIAMMHETRYAGPIEIGEISA